MSALSRLRVVVAGAGAVGSLAALALARAGAKVTVADPGEAGGNASAVAAGMLAPAFEMLFDPAPAQRLALLREARDLWPALAASVGLALDRRGALAAGAAEDVEAWAAAMARLGASAVRLESAAARRLCPWLAAGLAALMTGEDWRLEPAVALAALQGAARGDGVHFRRRAVEGFEAGE
ncbi:MAG: FAD-dependent oxidoreductase, partial [Caulobacteraceae bacterium]